MQRPLGSRIIINFDKLLQLFLLNDISSTFVDVPLMALQDFLLPLENVKFHSKTKVQYADKSYHILITDKRLILYAQRGHILKSDDIVSENLDRIEGIEYSEKGLMFRIARISIQGRAKIVIKGTISELKPLFNTMQSLINIG